MLNFKRKVRVCLDFSLFFTKFVYKLLVMSTYYYTYNVMGTANKKTGKYPTYKVKLKVTDTGVRQLVACDCKAREFRPFSPCKHMTLIHERLGHSF